MEKFNEDVSKGFVEYFQIDNCLFCLLKLLQSEISK